MRNLRPTGQRVLVENLNPLDNVGGILIPEAHRERNPAEAVVISVGRTVEIDVGGRPLAVGDRVYTARYSGTHVTVAGKQMRMLAPADILALINTDNP